MSDRQRIIELDVLRGVAIFGVLVLHSGFKSRFDPATLATQETLARLFDWSVLAFFFVSGILCHPAVAAGEFIQKRFMTLIIPFVLYSLFYSASFSVMKMAGPLGGPVADAGHGGWTAVLFHSPAFQLYFLPYLFLVLMLIFCIEKLNWHRLCFYGTILAISFLFYLYRGGWQMAHGSEWYKIPLYLSACVIGVLCKPMLVRPRSVHWFPLLGGAVIAGGALFLGWMSISLLVPPLLLMMFKSFHSPGQAGLLAYLGGHSGSIYLWHTPIILPAITMLLAHCKIPGMINFPASLCLTIGVCLLLHRSLTVLCVRWWHRPIPRWLAP